MDGNDLRVGIVQARFNDELTSRMATLCIDELVKLGVLREMPLGKEKLFIHPKLMQLLSRDNNQFQPYA